MFLSLVPEVLFVAFVPWLVVAVVRPQRCCCCFLRLMLRRVVRGLSLLLLVLRLVLLPAAVDAVYRCSSCSCPRSCCHVCYAFAVALEKISEHDEEEMGKKIEKRADLLA